jgi:hypothetical protein
MRNGPGSVELDLCFSGNGSRIGARVAPLLGRDQGPPS